MAFASPAQATAAISDLGLMLDENKLYDAKTKTDTRLGDLVFGSVAGITGKIVEYPFDTIKVSSICF
jgi:hypothetical protein